MKLLFISAPYRADTIVKLQHNINEARLMAQYYWLQGYAVICPHLNSANFDGLIDDEDFLQACLLMQAACSHIAFHPDWEQASGCKKEYLEADRLNQTKFFPDMKHIRDTVWGKI